MPAAHRTVRALGLGVALAAATVAPASAGSLLTVSTTPAVVRAGEAVRLHGRSGASSDGIVRHSAEAFALRPGSRCPPAPPPADDPDVLGSKGSWTFSEEDQPRSVSLLIQRPSGVGRARICTYVRPWTIGGVGDPVIPGPTTSVRIAASPRAWGSVVAVISPALRATRGRVPVRIACSSSHVETCRGTLRLRRGGRTLGTTRFVVPRGRERAARVPLNRQGRSTVRRGRSIRVTTELRPARGIRLTRRLVLTG